MNASTLADRLDKVDLVWILGGETFVLRRATALSEFDNEIVWRFEGDELAYGGFSAGSVVATPTFEGVHLMDTAENVPEGYPTQVIWDGLGLVNFAIVPHWRSVLPATTAADAMAGSFEKRDMPYERLSDGDAIIQNGDRIDVLRGT